MSAPTIAVDWVLARAAVRASGRLHLVSVRDTDALNPLCGANPIRSREIETHSTVPAGVPLCAGCTDLVGRLHTTVEALLDPTSAAATLRLVDVPLASITVPAGYARSTPGGDIEALVASVREQGVVAPVLVRRAGDGFELVDGVRRYYAATAADLVTVPAFVRDVDDHGAVVHALLANLHRADLNPIDQAHAYQRAIAELGLTTKAELGRLLGISREQISNTIRLLGLPQEQQDRIAAGELTAEGGRALLRGTPREASPLEQRLAQLLAAQFDATVALTTTTKRARIVLDVAPADLPRVLEQLGVQADEGLEVLAA